MGYPVEERKELDFCLICEPVHLFLWMLAFMFAVCVLLVFNFFFFFLILLSWGLSWGTQDV